MSYDTRELKVKGTFIEVGPSKYESGRIAAGILKRRDQDKKVIRIFTFIDKVLKIEVFIIAEKNT
jgi:hypothetical protein